MYGFCTNVCSMYLSANLSVYHSYPDPLYILSILSPPKLFISSKAIYLLPNTYFLTQLYRIADRKGQGRMAALEEHFEQPQSNS